MLRWSSILLPNWDDQDGKIFCTNFYNYFEHVRNFGMDEVQTQFQPVPVYSDKYSHYHAVLECNYLTWRGHQRSNPRRLHILNFDVRFKKCTIVSVVHDSGSYYKIDCDAHFLWGPLCFVYALVIPAMLLMKLPLQQHVAYSPKSTMQPPNATLIGNNTIENKSITVHTALTTNVWYF